MTNLYDWLLQGDPAIRWQTMRDLLDMPSEIWQPEQALTAEEGWGARLLAHQDSDGTWGGGLYSPKWVSSTYTLLTLRAIGIPRSTPKAQTGTALVLDGMLGKDLDLAFRKQLARCDRCVVGMILQLSVYFQIEDGRVEAMVQNLLDERMPDGAWNCRRGRDKTVHHSSFHTTLNVLEGLRDYLDFANPASSQRAAILSAEQSALEFLLQHQLYRSDKTNEVISEKFTYLSFPPRWYYDILRGLSCFASAKALQASGQQDARLQDAISLLQARQRSDGFWPVQHKHSGLSFFDMEKTGGPSRWNTLRALRVLKWWNNLKGSI